MGLRPAFVSVLMLGFASFASAAPQPSFKKVMVVVFENTDYDGAASQPFFASLAKQGALLTKFSAEAHPSQPNYIALIGGSTLGVKSDNPVNLSGTSLADLLEAKGRSWKVYAEDFPGDCYLGARQGLYARKHVPFLNFTSVQSNPERCAKVVNATELDADLAAGTLPDFSLYVPNLDNDGHDTDVAYADRWFSSAFGGRLADSKFRSDLLLVVTFDESESKGASNQVFTVLWGDGVVPGSTVDAQTSHYSILRTVEDVFGLGTLGRNDSKAQSITGIWR